MNENSKRVSDCGAFYLFNFKNQENIFLKNKFQSYSQSVHKIILVVHIRHQEINYFLYNFLITVKCSKA